MNVQIKLEDYGANPPKVPVARWLHTAVAVKEEMVVFGGATNTLQLLNDVWTFKPNANGAPAPAPPPPPRDGRESSRVRPADAALGDWKEVKVTGDAPEPREGHTAVVAGDNMVVFGGMGYGYTPYNDTWVYGAWPRRSRARGAGH